MAKGRPRYSLVRERLKQLLYILGPLTAYDAHRHYAALFASTSRRNIYYQLRNGVDMGVFAVYDVVEEEGDYSWGSTSRKVYYEFAGKSDVRVDDRIRDYAKNMKNHEKKQKDTKNHEKT